MIEIPLSLLPLCVVILLTLGSAALSPENWAAEQIERYQLTREQVEQLGTIENQYSDEIAQLRQQLGQSERELIDLIVSTTSADQIRQREDQFEALQAAAARLYFDKFLEMREVLTVAQRRQLCSPLLRVQ
jgi:Spy/CpxP family protein refolding chaperone